MAITFRHDAAAVAPPSNSSTRKYGQQLVLQQQQQKYQSQQAAYDRMFDAYRQANQNQFQLGRDAQDRNFQLVRDQQQNAFQVERDKRLNEFDKDRDQARMAQQQAEMAMRQQQMNAERQQGFADQAMQLERRSIMDAIDNGEYDEATATELRNNIIAESNALGNPEWDAPQRAEILTKLRARRAELEKTRMPRANATATDRLQKRIGVAPNGAMFLENSKGDFTPVKDESRPMNAAEAFRSDPKIRDRYAGDAKEMLANGDNPDDAMDRRKVNAKAMELYQIDQESFPVSPTDAPSLPSGIAPEQGQSQSILDQPAPDSKLGQLQSMLERGQPPTPIAPPTMAARPDPGQPPAPKGKLYSPQLPLAQTTPPVIAQRPDEGQPPAPSPQSVSVNGKPLVVTPGTMTPQETAARQQIMQLPREQRIAALMPYDPQFKGQTLEQLLENPETKAGYEALSKDGLTTGNYREDILAQLDETLQYNVMNGAGQAKPEAYVGMNINDITDPKVKAEFKKLPMPKSEQDMLAITGPYFIDPDGVIRGTRK